MIIFLINFCVGICSNMFKHTPRLVTSPKNGVFSHAQSKQRGCRCLRDNAKCYHSSKFSYVALCCFIYYIIFTYMYMLLNIIF